MQHTRTTGLQGQFAKKGEDIKNGDALKILSGGTELEGKFGRQIVFRIETRNGERLQTFNQTSINAFVDEYGPDDTKWVGKNAHVIVVRVPGKDPYFYFAPDGYVVGDNGLEREGQPEPKDDIPTVQIEDEVKVEDVPF